MHNRFNNTLAKSRMCTIQLVTFFQLWSISLTLLVLTLLIADVLQHPTRASGIRGCKKCGEEEFEWWRLWQRTHSERYKQNGRPPLRAYVHWIYCRIVPDWVVLCFCDTPLQGSYSCTHCSFSEGAMKQLGPCWGDSDMMMTWSWIRTTSSLRESQSSFLRHRRLPPIPSCVSLAQPPKNKQQQCNGGSLSGPPLIYYYLLTLSNCCFVY